MWIEEGGVFVDVLSGEGDNLWEDEMVYVGWILGFWVFSLDLWEWRLVWEVLYILFLFVFFFCLRIYIICVINFFWIGCLMFKNFSYMFVMFCMFEDILLGLFFL